MQKTERVRIPLEASWFDMLVQSLQDTREGLMSIIEKGGEDWEGELERNETLLKRIALYSHYYKSEAGEDFVDIQVFPREASELVWQLLLCCSSYVEPPAKGTHYEKCKSEHEEYVRKRNAMPQVEARELFHLMSVGYDLLVKNKDGKCYHVDHGRSGDLIKKGGKWEDPEYGFDENVFQKARYSYKIVSWSDESPLDVRDYLLKEGWMKVVGSEYKFVPQG